MMGPFATVMLGGCLNALRWLLWFTVGLIVVAILAMLWRGETPANPGALLVLAAVLRSMGWACLWLVHRLVGKTAD